jgi:ribosomal protein S1
MELTWNENPISLDQVVSVTLTKIDEEKKKIEFSLNQ